MRRYNPYHPANLAVLLLFLLVITACSNDTAVDTTSAEAEQILNIGNGTEPQDLDPHIVTGVTEHNIISALLEGLVGKDPVDLSPVPATAESWEINADGTVYTFHLRTTAKWSNGDPLTADDFVYAWRRALMPQLGNQYAYMLYPVLNAEAFNKGQINDFDKVGVRSLDKSTLEVTLAYPTPYFLGILDHYSSFPLHQASIEKFGDIDTRGSEWTRAGNYVGNGPFMLTRWEQNRIIVVEKNPHYWDAKTVRLNAIQFFPIDQMATEERMFRTGQLHITNSIPQEKIASYRKDNPELLIIHPYLGTYFYDINTSKPPLDNIKVRRALALSIDRTSIVENITKGGQRPAYTLTPPDTLGYTARARVPYDIDRAKQLLSEAGYPNGEGFPTIQLLYNTLETHQQIALALQQMWKQALNIDISLHNQEWKVYLDSRQTGDYQLARASWIGDYVDPNTFLDMYVTDGGNNQTRWSNKEYDRLISEASITTDQNQRYELFQRAEEILMREVPIIPVYTYSRVFLKSPAVQGWHPNLMDHHPYKYVYLEAPATE